MEEEGKTMEEEEEERDQSGAILHTFTFMVACVWGRKFWGLKKTGMVAGASILGVSIAQLLFGGGARPLPSAGMKL